MTRLPSAPARKDRLDGLATAVLFACCLAWGLNQVAIKVTISGISPMVGAGLRSILAAALVWIWCRARGERLFSRDGTLAHGLLIGGLFAAEFAVLYWGLAFTTASRCVIFLYAAPFFVALGAHRLIPGERLTLGRVSGLLLAFSGLLVAFADGLSLPDRWALVGDGLELLAAFLWAATTVVIKRRSELPITPAKTLFYQLGVSGPALILAGPLVGETGVVSLTPAVVVAFLYQAVLVAFVSYVAWFWLLAHYPASSLSAFSFWTPLFGVVAGGAILSEPVTPWLGLAGLLVAAGIVLVNRPARSPRPPTARGRWSG